MLLVLTNSQDATANYLCARLRRQGIPFARLDTDRLASNTQVSYSLNDIALEIEGIRLRPEDISNIWHRRPQNLEITLSQRAEENEQIALEWAEAIEGFLAHVPISKWVNHPAYNTMASHKLEQISRASKMGLSIPRTLVTWDPQEVRNFWNEQNGNVITKPLASGYIDKGDSAAHIYTSPVSGTHLTQLHLISSCPTLFQGEIAKAIDVRVCILDNYLLAAGITATDLKGKQNVDIRRNNMADAMYEELSLPPGLKSKLFRLIKSYGLRFAAIDMAITASGEWIFFEVNPNGQWAWLDLAAGFDVGGFFIEVFHKNAH